MRINKTTLVRCVITALAMTLFGMVLQVTKGQLIYKLPPPKIGFIIGVVISYILVGFLFALAFSIFRNALPGKTPQRKGLYYAMLCSLVVMIPGIMGMNAFDFEGQYNLFTPYKIEQYLTCLIDVMNLCVGGLMLGKLFKVDIEIKETVNTPKKRLLISGLIGAVVLPLLIFAVHLLAEEIFPIGLDIPGDANEWYYIATITPFVLTGAFLPLFYQSVKDALAGSRVIKSVKFFVVFFVCYWLMNVAFMLNFGFSLQYVIILLAISIPSLLSIIMLNGIMLEKDHEEISFCAEEESQ